MSQRLTVQSAAESQTHAAGAAVGGAAREGDIVALIGDLGAGKTHFVRGLAEGLGIDPWQVSSPTFVLVQEYEPDHADGLVLVHIDAYRLRGPQDLPGIGWAEQGEELREGAVVAIEWADLVLPGLGGDYLEVRLEHAREGRRITFWPHGAWAPRIDDLRTRLKVAGLSPGSGS